jgi:hypothetical protein
MGGTVQIIGNSLNDESYIQEEIKSGMNSGNAYYYPVQDLLSSSNRGVKKNM